MRPIAYWISALLLTSACGGSPQQKPAGAPVPAATKVPRETDSVAANATEKKAPETTDDSAPVPSRCAKTNPCVPSAEYVKRLCKVVYPSVALSFFRGGTPWQRGYLRRKTEAINASGGVSGEGYLEFDEEVIVLQQRKSDYGGMQVSGAMGGYYVLRWDGTCNDISGEELTFDKPPQAKTAKIEWRFLDENTQDALRADTKLNELVNARRRECKGASSGEVSKKCVDLDRKLTDSIAKAVRAGIELPAPMKHP